MNNYRHYFYYHVWDKIVNGKKLMGEDSILFLLCSHTQGGKLDSNCDKTNCTSLCFQDLQK